jgi:hypothetical protein
MSNRQQEKKKGKDSQALTFKWLSEFDPESVRGQVLDVNIVYLEKMMERLEGLMVKAAGESKTASTARARAIARDTEKSTAGLLNGIKFGISFLLYGEKENLNEDSNSERQEIQ